MDIDFNTIVLCGGSGKGIALLGALQYLIDQKIINNIDTYIGTSVGTIIGFLLIIGYTPIEIIIYMCTNNILEKVYSFNIVEMINGNGALSFANFQETLEKMTIEKIGILPTLSDLYKKFNKTLILTTYNLTKHKVEYLSYKEYPDLPCLTAIRMSSNLPLIFEPYTYNNSQYIDGGVVDNFPIDVVDKMNKKILGLNIPHKLKEGDMHKNIIEYIYTLLSIPSSKYLDEKIKTLSDNCFVATIDCDSLSNFNFNIDSITKLDIFSSGYNQIRDYLKNTNGEDSEENESI